MINDVSWSDHSVLSEVDTLKHTLKQLQSNQSFLLLYLLFTRKECGSWGRFPNGCRLALTSFVSLRRRSHRRSETEWSFLQHNYCTGKAKNLWSVFIFFCGILSAKMFFWFFLNPSIFFLEKIWVFCWSSSLLKAWRSTGPWFPWFPPGRELQEMHAGVLETCVTEVGGEIPTHPSRLPWRCFKV